MKVCVFLLTFALAGSVAAQTRGNGPAKKPQAKAASAYDTPEQTEKKKDALLYWSLENSSKERPAASRPEYCRRVLDILKRMRPHPITFEMYEELSTNEYLDGTGDFICDAWLKLGGLPTELSRSSSGDYEIVVYQWRNPDGSDVVAAFRNDQVVSKVQHGLR